MFAKVIEFSFESGTLLGGYCPKKSPELNRGLRLYFDCSGYFAAAALAFLVNLLFRLAALFLWMMPFLASLSIIETTLGKPSA